MNKYRTLMFGCMSINENFNKAMQHAGLISQKILTYKAIPLLPFLVCFGNNQNKEEYEELWKSMIRQSDVVVIFDKVDEEMQKQIDYAKTFKKKILWE